MEDPDRAGLNITSGKGKTNKALYQRLSHITWAATIQVIKEACDLGCTLDTGFRESRLILNLHQLGRSSGLVLIW